MVRRQKTANRQPQKKQVKPKSVTQPTLNQVGLNGQMKLSNMVGNGDIQAQAARLGDPYLQTSQHQALATHIGRVQGNQHLQRVLDVVDRKPVQSATLKRQSNQVQRLKKPANIFQAALDFFAARQQHKSDRVQLKQWVKEAAEQKDDRRLRNAAKLVLNNRLKMYAVTKTGDSDERVAEAGKDVAEYFAMFPEGTDENGPGHIMAPAVEYNWQDLDDNTNVEIDTKGTGGWELSGLIAIVNPSSKGRTEVWETLRHEGQHATDASRQEEAKLGGTDVMSKQQRRFEKYKTEYRAYSYEGGDFDNFSHITTVKALGHVWTEKQLQIFAHMYGDDDYAFVEKGWDEANDAARTWFRQQVVDYKDPDSLAFNKYDSYTVLDFYKKLDAVPANTADVTHGKVKDLLDILKAGDISAEDATYTLYESAPMLKKIYAHLSGQAREAVQNRLNTRAEKTAGLLNFQRKLMEVPTGTNDKDAGTVQTLIEATKALSADDAEYLFLKNKAFTQIMQERLQGAALRTVQSARLSDKVPAAVAAVYEFLLSIPLQTHDVTHAGVQQLLGAIPALSEPEAIYVLTQLEDQLNSHIIGKAHEAVTNRLRKKAGL